MNNKEFIETFLIRRMEVKMGFQQVTWKFPGRRNAEEFSIYKEQDRKVLIQSDKSIAQIDLDTKKMIANFKGQQSKYFHHLNEFMGAVEMDCPIELFEAVTSRIPQKGDEIAQGIIWG
jgi:hypothetical protein